MSATVVVGCAVTGARGVGAGEDEPDAEGRTCWGGGGLR